MENERSVEVIESFQMDQLLELWPLLWQDAAIGAIEEHIVSDIEDRDSDEVPLFTNASNYVVLWDASTVRCGILISSDILGLAWDGP